MRVGIGQDMHKLADGGRLVIGGIEIDSPRGAVAHSDGDVLIHAVIDAMLGAAALGAALGGAGSRRRGPMSMIDRSRSQIDRK